MKTAFDPQRNDPTTSMRRRGDDRRLGDRRIRAELVDQRRRIARAATKEGSRYQRSPRRIADGFRRDLFSIPRQGTRAALIDVLGRRAGIRTPPEGSLLGKLVPEKIDRRAAEVARTLFVQARARPRRFRVPGYARSPLSRADEATLRDPKTRGRAANRLGLRIAREEAMVAAAGGRTNLARIRNTWAQASEKERAAIQREARDLGDKRSRIKGELALHGLTRGAIGAGRRIGRTVWRLIKRRLADRAWRRSLARVRKKIPKEWGPGAPNRKKTGFRWEHKKGDGVRVDRGDPRSRHLTQRRDHVIVRRNGKVIGRDGRPIDGSIRNNPVQAHIPLKEWLKWKTWYAP